MRTALAILAALLLTGCALTIQGDRERWRTAYTECGRENFDFTFIPDGGITFERHRDKCMRARHWLRHGGFTWIWTGPVTESAYQLPPTPPPPPPGAAPEPSLINDEILL